MKKKRFLSALVIGALVGTMTLGTTSPVNATSHIVINGSGSGSDTWEYGYTENDTLWTSNDSMGDHDEDYLKFIGSDIEDDITLNSGGSLETHHSHANGKLVANGGNLRVSEGTLHINSGSSIASAVALTVNGTIDMTGGSVTVNGSDTVSGRINATGGILTIGGTSTGSRTLNSSDYSVGGSTKTVIDGAVVSNISLAGTGGIQIDSGSLTINSDNVDASVSNGVSNGLILTGGTLEQNVSGTGSTKISAGTGTVYNNATISQNVNVDAGTFFNNANHTVGTGTTTSINTGASATNEGSMAAVNNSGTFRNQGSGTTGAITNNKTLYITGGSVASVSNADSANSVATQSGGTVTGNVTNSGQYTLSGSGQINGVVTNSGTFNLKNSNVSTYSQTTGGSTLNITDGSALNLNNGTYTITNGRVNLGDASNTTGSLTISNGLTTNKADIRTVGTGGSTLDIQNGTLQTLGSSSIAETAIVKIGSSENNGTLQLSNGSLTLNSGTGADTWNANGTVTVDGGSLSLKGVTQNGTFNQTSGSTTIDAAQTLTDKTTISGGNLNITNGNLTVNGANAVVGTGATINLASGRTLNIQNTKTAAATDGITFDAGDTWAGVINQTGGLLTLSGRTGASADSTGTNQKITMTDGSLVLEGSSLTLNSGSYIQGGTVKIDPSTLIVDNGVANHSVVNMEDDGSVFTIRGAGTTYTLDNGSTIKDHGTVTVGDNTNANQLTLNGNTSIASEVDMILNTNSITNMNGTSSLTMNSGDTWNGRINLNAGSLTVLNELAKTNGSLVTTNGTLTIGNNDTTADVLNLNNGNDVIAAGTTVVIRSDGKLNQTAGSAILNTGDDWSGEVALGGGTLEINNLTVSTDDEVIYNQTDGTLTIDNGGSLTLNTDTTGSTPVSSSITGGNVILGSNNGTPTVTTDDTAGTLVVNNGLTTNQAKVTTAGTSTSNSFSVTGANTAFTTLTGTDFEVGSVTVGDGTNASTLNLSNNGIIAKAVTLKVDKASTLNVNGATAQATINTGDTWNGTINQTGGVITVMDNIVKDSNTAKLVSTNGEVIIGYIGDPAVTADDVAGTLNLNNKYDSIAAETLVTLNHNGTLNQSNGSVTLDKDTDVWEGAVSLSDKGQLLIKNFTTATPYVNEILTDGTIRYNQTGGKATLDNSYLELAYDATKPSQITDGKVALTNSSKLTIANGLVNGAAANGVAITMADANETLVVRANIADPTAPKSSKLVLGNYLYDDGTTSGELNQTSIAAGTVRVGTSGIPTDHSVLELSSGTIAQAAAVTINEGAALNITGASAKDETTSGAGDAIVAAITLDGADNWNGDINLSNASTADNKNVSLTLTGVTKTTGANPTFDNTGSSPYYSQTGGSLALTNNTKLSMTDSSLISGGNLTVDTNSTFNSLSNAFSVANLTNAGLVNGINGGYENYAVSTGFYAGDSLGDKQGDFTTDLYARCNINKNFKYDSYGSDSATIYASDPSKYGILNVSDWTLNGDIYGWDAPIDRSYNLNKLFRGSVAAGHTIDFTSTNKEVFTPIGWYGLHSAGGGNYTFDLNRYNPGVFRGQVTTIAQYQNQLMIDDMLFNHTMLDQGFKGNDYISSNPNRLASATDLYPPYQYSRKDGGVWVKTYGTFEKLNMNHGLNVGNNAYGTLIGVDFGLKDLKHGWQFMPTAYIGYNGAHQYWNGYGAYQNGGQLGVMGTWYKDNFMIGALAYGGVYGNDMSTPRGDDTAFNYFAGGSVKAAYNWRFAKDWSLQPNLMVAYNYFGQQNWHTDFGQMGMMSGMLNGINVAPGLNLIWEKETFSVYGTVQYMYNCNQSTGGRAGHVSLPHVHMDRGYIQYGLGVNKRFTDRFSGFLQAVIRNVGRNGVGLQAGFQWQLGKGGSKDVKKSNLTPELKKTEISLNSNKVQ